MPEEFLVEDIGVGDLWLVMDLMDTLLQDQLHEFSVLGQWCKERGVRPGEIGRILRSIGAVTSQPHLGWSDEVCVWDDDYDDE